MVKRYTKLVFSSIFVLTLSILTLALSQTSHGQTRIDVPAEAEGWYWLVSPKPWFTRQLTISVKNRKLPKNDHDDSLPTFPGYYHRTKELSPYTRYRIKSIVVRRRKTEFVTRVINGIHFSFRGKWGKKYDKESNIENVPYIKGLLFTYRKGKLIKTEKVEFGHAVNA